MKTGDKISESSPSHGSTVGTTDGLNRASCYISQRPIIMIG